MFFNFGPNFIAKFFWESGFSKILVRWLFRETKIRFFFWPPFWNETFLIVLFTDIKIVVLRVYTYGSSFVPKFLREITQKGMGPSGPSPWPLVHKHEWKYNTEFCGHFLLPATVKKARAKKVVRMWKMNPTYFIEDI